MFESGSTITHLIATEASRTYFIRREHHGSCPRPTPRRRAFRGSPAGPSRPAPGFVGAVQGRSPSCPPAISRATSCESACSCVAGGFRSVATAVSSRIDSNTAVRGPTSDHQAGRCNNRGLRFRRKSPSRPPLGEYAPLGQIAEIPALFRFVDQKATAARTRVTS